MELEFGGPRKVRGASYCILMDLTAFVLTRMARPFKLFQCAVSRTVQLLFYGMNVIAAFTLVQVGLRCLFSANCGFPFQLAVTMGARTRIDITRLHGVLHL